MPPDMPPRPLSILDLDGSVTSQTELVSSYKPAIVDLRDLGPAARFWMDERTRRRLAERVPAMPEGSLVFLGSGDFHHLTSLIAGRVTGPFSLISFDAHPDWDTASPLLSCGSWVSRLLRSRADLAKVLLLGAVACDASPFLVMTGSLNELSGDRVELYPYQSPPVVVPFRAVPDSISVSVDRRGPFSILRWQELTSKNMLEFFMHVLKRLPTKRVYVTIDKDCLSTDYALTNWGQGGLSLDDLLIMLKEIKEQCEIVGIDITGDYSPIRVKGIVKNVASYLNRPRRIKAEEFPPPFITRANEQTNLKLLELLAGG